MTRSKDQWKKSAPPIAQGTFEAYRREFVVNYVPTQKVLLARAAEAER